MPFNFWQLDFGNALLGRLEAEKTHNDAHVTPSVMFSNATHTAMTGAGGDITTVSTPPSAADTGEAFPGLPNHLVVAHMLKSEYFDDPADLARLPAVSRAMRDAVAATGLEFEELDELVDYRAAELALLSVLKRRDRRGHLSRQEYLCQAAARGGHLEELKLLRADGARGTSGRARGVRKAGILRCFSGCVRTAARGMKTRAWLQLTAGTSGCCSGHTQKAARGTS